MKIVTVLYFILAQSLLFVLLVGCGMALQEIPADGTMTFTPSLLATATKKVDVTKTPISMSTTIIETSIPSQTEDAEIHWLDKSLPSGEYLYVEGHTEDSELIHEVFSLEAQEMLILPITDLSPHPIGNHGSVLLFKKDIEAKYKPIISVHLSSFSDPGQFIEVPTDCWYRDISPDEKYLLVSDCVDMFQTEIGVVEIDTGKIIQLTFSDDIATGIHRDKGLPLFSPDGKWILYFDIPYQNEYEKEWGLYLMPALCIGEPDTCKELTQGPFWTENMFMSDEDFMAAWSPDALQIVMGKRNPPGLMIFDFTTHEFSEIDMGVDFTPRKFSWLSGGDWITFTADVSPTKRNDIVYIYNWEKNKLDMKVINLYWIFLSHVIVIN